MPVLHWPFRAFHRHFLFGAVVMAMLISIAPWRWLPKEVSTAGTVIGPSVQRLQAIGAEVPSAEQANNLVRLVRSNSLYHQVGIFTLTGLCRRLPSTEQLWRLDETVKEQTLPSGQRILRSDNLYHWSNRQAQEYWQILDPECDLGAFAPLEATTEYIYWYQPCLGLAPIPESKWDDVQRRTVACYQLKAALGY
jgi:hypothetical protein